MNLTQESVAPASNNPGKPQDKLKVSFPNLDGLRFFCFLGVFLFHSFATGNDYIRQDGFYKTVKNFLVANGNLGVNFFFVLSGFLITYLLLIEKSNYKKIKIGNFYIRRILKIWPLFYMCVFFGFIIFPALKILWNEPSNETASITYYILFLNNFDFIKNGPPDSSTLSILWSVAVEEQFYLVWPLLLSLVTVKYLPHIFFLIIALSFVFRIIRSDSDTVLEHHTLSCISDMTVGGLLAYYSFFSKRFIDVIKNAPKYIWVLLYALVILVLLYRREIFDHGSILKATDRLLISLIFGLVILEQNFATKSFYKMSRFTLVTKLGTYTYGLYCLHMIGILIASKTLIYFGLNKNVYQVIFLEGALSLIVIIGIAFMSYHFYEKWFLKLKNRFARVTR